MKCLCCFSPAVKYTLSGSQVLLASTLLYGASAAAADQTLTVTAEHPSSTSSYNQDDAAATLRTATPRSETPQSISVVTPQVMKDYQVTSLNDAVKFVSGVTQGNTLGGTEDGFVKRGFGSNTDGSIFIDGVRSNQGLTMDSSIDHVEVLKGSSSLLYGILNPGGIINLVSKKPQYQWNTHISGESSSFGGGTGMVDVTGPLGNGFAFRMVAERQREDYWRNFGVNEHTLLAPSLSWYGDRANFNVSYVEYKYDVPYDRGTAFIGGKPVDIPYNRRLDDYANHAWGKNKRLNVSYGYNLDDVWETHLNYGWMQRRYDSNEVRATAINTSTGIVSRRADANRGFNHQTEYVSWDISGSPTFAGMQHDLLLGVDYEQNETYKARSYRGSVSRSFNMYDPVYGEEPILSDSTYNDSISNLRTNLYSRSLFAKDSIHLTDKWIAVLGGRFQRYTQTSSNGFIDPETTLNDRGNAFLPQVGVVYKVLPDVSLYGSYSKSFTPSTQTDDNGDVASTEKGSTWEVGSKWQVAPNLAATLALYRIDETDMSIFINGVTRNIPKARSTGAELEINGEITPDWNLIANYSYDKTEIVADNVNPDNVGNRLVNAPTNMGSLYLSHTLRFSWLPGELRLGGGGRYVGTRAGDPENSFVMPAYTVADAFIAWDSQLIGKHTQLKLNVKNLLNREYYESSAGNLRVIEGEPRVMYLQASVDF
ncbi:iron complex outermembrane recepter protein [Candidatus Pantoea symbiotica]|jgi:iron complex outermembrane receptor protein|uniref:Iron complex outermembrane recepter protein n=1 Tax=Candidatus Pantoea symbiotica TaxID=1884370 RepID=A0A1I3ZQH0_9GAMM|nr:MULTISPECIES: TonB-dependent siderophore receptor [Pantoea]KAJ9430077.1 TonB-dependent siderophore receptor [Pantoea sp. YR343]MRT26663.1 TonB-dependent siderophore receptor [Enterobacteriaceae bacterium RIT697]SFK46130.1 iron complex outermembrane recepter protein [Pantoea symbiotica]SFU92481.1 iron complex outermembrane recepter protein [Pantoea sp. YR525]